MLGGLTLWTQTSGVDAEGAACKFGRCLLICAYSMWVFKCVFKIAVIFTQFALLIREYSTYPGTFFLAYISWLKCCRKPSVLWTVDNFFLLVLDLCRACMACAFIWNRYCSTAGQLWQADWGWNALYCRKMYWETLRLQRLQNGRYLNRIIPRRERGGPRLLAWNMMHVH